MENFFKIKEDIKKQLDEAKYEGDLSDIGNEIGIVIGKYPKEEVNDFFHGLKHGISLADGTHLSDFLFI